MNSCNIIFKQKRISIQNFSKIEAQGLKFESCYAITCIGYSYGQKLKLEWASQSSLIIVLFFLLQKRFLRWLPTVSMIHTGLTGWQTEAQLLVMFSICVPGICSEYQQQTKNFNFDELSASMVVAMTTCIRKDGQHFAIFQLFTAISRVTAGEISLNLTFW